MAFSFVSFMFVLLIFRDDNRMLLQPTELFAGFRKVGNLAYTQVQGSNLEVQAIMCKIVAPFYVQTTNRVIYICSTRFGWELNKIKLCCFDSEPTRSQRSNLCHLWSTSFYWKGMGIEGWIVEATAVIYLDDSKLATDLVGKGHTELFTGFKKVGNSAST